MKKFFTSSAFALIIFISFGQGTGFNTTGASANASAGVDIDFTNKGLLIPRVSLTSITDAATITSPATSLLVYNSNAAMTNGNGLGYYYWDGAKWLPAAMTSNSGGPCAPSQITNELNNTPTAATGTVCTTANCGATKNLLNCILNCEMLNYNNFTDWRVPSIEELMNLIPGAPFYATSINSIWTISGNFDAASNYAIVRLSDVSMIGDPGFGIQRCRCVR